MQKLNLLTHAVDTDIQALQKQPSVTTTHKWANCGLPSATDTNLRAIELQPNVQEYQYPSTPTNHKTQRIPMRAARGVPSATNNDLPAIHVQPNAANIDLRAARGPVGTSPGKQTLQIHTGGRHLTTNLLSGQHAAAKRYAQEVYPVIGADALISLKGTILCAANLAK